MSPCLESQGCQFDPTLLYNMYIYVCSAQIMGTECVAWQAKYKSVKIVLEIHWVCSLEYLPSDES